MCEPQVEGIILIRLKISMEVFLLSAYIYGISIAIVVADNARNLISNLNTNISHQQFAICKLLFSVFYYKYV